MDDSQPITAPSLIGCHKLEQFLLLAKTAHGPAAVELIKQVLDAPGVYVFSELLETNCVKELASEADSKYVQLLELFAYGTYGDYKSKADTLPPLTPAQTTKLRHLTIVSLAAKCHTIPYSTLQQELDISDLRELEDLVIEAIYAGIMQAKLDQKNSQLEVECFIGRDIKMEAIAGMITKLEDWCSNCTSVLQAVEEQMQRANQLKSDSSKDKDKHDQEAKQLRQTLKVAANDDEIRVRDHSGQLVAPRQPLKKGLRGSDGHRMMFGKK